MFKWSKEITPSQVIKLMRAEKDVEKLILVFDSAAAEYANGFLHDESSFGYMVSRGYGRVHRLFDSLRVFHKMKNFDCDPTHKGYVTLLAILLEENQLKLAFKFYKNMREIGLPPTVASLNVLIKALCRNEKTVDAGVNILLEMPKRGCDPDSYTYGTLISDCSPTAVTYTSMIHGFCGSKNVEEALRYLEEMKSNSIEPNVFTYSSLMDGLCKDGRALQAIELFEMMMARGCRPNIVTYNTLITGLCKEGKIQEAIELFDRINLQGLKPNAGLYGKIISGFFAVSKFREAVNFLDEMILGGITPNRLTWNIRVRTSNEVVRGLCTSYPTRAFTLYLSMRSRGISVEVETLDSLVKCLCKKGEFQKAVQLVNEIVADGCIPNKGTWKVLIGHTLDKTMVGEASEYLLRDLGI
ncbi:unnamed protein product [Brassica oleracea var. botrytis]|uniref:Pentacotripeptide-repeat region of PRORP domain-containing protein n=3 Tax=Brassica TaxID=3705 RepID=A0A0D3AUH6_BRAOL|nr:unnamed protein product [Brassica napus]CDY53416.1 BnaC02g47100D [Brassica napus]VDD25315.1 unnamed protein product [Brassica oleracea]